MKLFRAFFAVLLAAAPAAVPAPARPLPQEKKDYLTPAEADRIRDTMNPGDRIRLYISFAEDRLKKFQYEVARKSAEDRHDEILNSLLNAYIGCVDDGTDQIEVAREHQVDIRAALKLFDSKTKEFLESLQKIDKNSPDYDAYQDTLLDAMEGTQEDRADIEEALKALSPEPIRRKPS